MPYPKVLFENATGYEPALTHHMTDHSTASVAKPSHGRAYHLSIGKIAVLSDMVCAEVTPKQGRILLTVLHIPSASRPVIDATRDTCILLLRLWAPSCMPSLSVASLTKVRESGVGLLGYTCLRMSLELKRQQVGIPIGRKKAFEYDDRVVTGGEPREMKRGFSGV